MHLIDSIRRFFEMPTRAERDAKKLNLKLDAQLFMNMCRTLLAEAPKGSEILIMEATRPAETTRSDGLDWELECSVKKSTGKDAKFTPSKEAREKLLGWLQDLRVSMKQQKQPDWKGCKLTVDVPQDKYNVDFKY